MSSFAQEFPPGFPVQGAYFKKIDQADKELVGKTDNSYQSVRIFKVIMPQSTTKKSLATSTVGQSFYLGDIQYVLTALCDEEFQVDRALMKDVYIIEVIDKVDFSETESNRIKEENIAYINQWVLHNGWQMHKSTRLKQGISLSLSDESKFEKLIISEYQGRIYEEDLNSFNFKGYTMIEIINKLNEFYGKRFVLSQHVLFNERINLKIKGSTLEELIATFKKLGFMAKESDVETLYYTIERDD